MDRSAIDENPQPGVEAAELGLDGGEKARALAMVEAIFRRLRTMPDWSAGPPGFGVAEARDDGQVEVGEGAAVASRS